MSCMVNGIIQVQMLPGGGAGAGTGLTLYSCLRASMGLRFDAVLAGR
jgi:hypothetical protein